MLDRQDRIEASLAPEGYTPTLDRLNRRFADFETLGEALDYAARGNRGMNFHDARGTLVRAYPYAELREDALVHARRFMALGLKKGDRLALIAETGPEFAACFFGAIYAGLWPVPLPLPTSFGGREAYVEQLAVMLASSDPQLFLYPSELADFALAAAKLRNVAARDWDSLGEVEPAGALALPEASSDEIAYLQYSSGSTRFPHGVAVTHRALLDNLHAHGVATDVQ
ncbi:MAG TPA: AMP-binding protein, partial [Sphingomicrobium sp.]|nr:AMP-binding protein [Sphingomicrobium sp.]